MREGGGLGLRVPLPAEPSGRGGTVAAVGAAQRAARPAGPRRAEAPGGPRRGGSLPRPCGSGPSGRPPHGAPARSAQRTLPLGSYLALSESPGKAQLRGGMDLKVSPPKARPCLPQIRAQPGAPGLRSSAAGLGSEAGWGACTGSGEGWGPRESLAAFRSRRASSPAPRPPAAHRVCVGGEGRVEGRA